MSKTVTVYTTNACAYCVMVKRWLQTKGLRYEEVNLEESPERQKEMMELSGQMAVPVVVVAEEDSDSKNITIGWNPGKLASAVAPILEMERVA
ncbi:MAG: glutaredoxin [Candidatus Woesebacteria bacterium]